MHKFTYENKTYTLIKHKMPYRDSFSNSEYKISFFAKDEQDEEFYVSINTKVKKNNVYVEKIYRTPD